MSCLPAIFNTVGVSHHRGYPPPPRRSIRRPMPYVSPHACPLRKLARSASSAIDASHSFIETLIVVSFQSIVVLTLPRIMLHSVRFCSVSCSTMRSCGALMLTIESLSSTDKTKDWHCCATELEMRLKRSPNRCHGLGQGHGRNQSFEHTILHPPLTLSILLFPPAGTHHTLLPSPNRYIPPL